jgi:integrase
MSTKRAKLNRHLYLRNGVWWTRIMRNGVEVRESTKCPASEVVAARNIRNTRLAQLAEAGAGLERPVEPLLLGQMLKLYLARECQPYDREKGGEQPGTKRAAKSDEITSRNILKHLSPSLSAARIDREILLGLAERRERELPMPAPLTRRNTFAFFRRAFSWAAARPMETGIRISPFTSLPKADRARIFPRGQKRAYVFSPDQLARMYARLPSYAYAFVRFAVHTGMRLRELTTLTWENVNLEEKVAHVEARFAKNKKARDVALGDVAVSILSALQPADPSGPVFIGRRGEPIQDLRGAFDAAVLEVWKPARPGEKKPRFHDLRKTGATRVESVSSKAVAKAFLGHADEDVTDSYIEPGLEDVRSAVNRAARAIDGGDTPPGVLVFRPKTAHQTAHGSQKQAHGAKEPKATTLADPLIQQALPATIPVPAKVAELVDAQVSGTCG